MANALIVSAGSNANEYLARHMAELGYARPVIVPSGGEARRQMDGKEFEVIVINTPLPDEFGHELGVDAVQKTDAGVILLAKAAACDELLAPMNEQGVLVVAKPFSAALFLQAVHMAAASNHRLQQLRAENDRLQQKMAELRLTGRAKCLLVQHRGMTEAEAHRYLEKTAMDTRRSRAQVAQDVLDSLDPDAVDGV